ncbi:hypothetical protein GCM10008956_39350 [Deinococcus arenae]|uniref:Uncharacterized protein n=1 Tax=Deinococcus arenae TaxID=1452751 RepID=A0A8H9L7Y7_9DEIO|nr:MULTISPECIES: hypothetical protein [Deinococcus]GGM59801.1 hypothetical protein GCM10008956_39350 [Deinococcus arenae]
MTTPAKLVLLLVMVGLIAGLDLSVFRHHTLARLAANVGVVLLALAFYLRLN